MQGAFSKCPALTSVKLPNTLLRIGANAFLDNTALTTIDIPASVESISYGSSEINGAFANCTKLATVNFLANNTDVNGSGSASITSVSAKVATSLIIGQYTFNGCSSLKEITLPSNVTEIQSQAFNNCKALTTININSTENFNPWKLAFYNIGSSNVTVNVPNQTIKNKIENECNGSMNNVKITYNGENKEANVHLK